MNARSIVASLFLVLCSNSAMALPIATLSFRDPTGVVAANEPIEVWLRLTLDANSTPLTTDADGNVTSGLDPSDVPAGATITRSFLNNAFECSGTFTSLCTSGPPYNFGFAFPPLGIVGAQNFDLQPGGSIDFLFGTFLPGPGPVAPGEYVFHNAIALISPQGTDSSGAPLSPFLPFASTCPTRAPDCSFTRRIVPAQVPAPSALACLVAAALLVGVCRTRRDGVRCV